MTTTIAAPAGALRITTEFGVLNVLPGQIAVVQRGMRFSVALPGGPARGYVLEVFGGHFALPDLGLIGASAAVQLAGHPAALCDAAGPGSYPCVLQLLRAQLGSVMRWTSLGSHLMLPVVGLRSS